MKLTAEQLRSVALGAERVEESAEGVCFYRFTEAEEALYRRRDSENGKFYHDRALCSSGVRLLFKTDSEVLSISVEMEKRSSRTFFAFDLSVNGAYLESLKNFEEKTLPAGYTAAEIPLPLGRFEKEFSLGAGEKTVSLDFPALACAKNFSLSLSDGASLIPVKPQRKLLMYGDSITQGYDALFPTHRYGRMLAEALDAEELNKAIGGETFFPDLAKERTDFDPDIVTVAYGTNDWSVTDGLRFSEYAREFYGALAKNYPKARIFAITPIYRKDMGASKPFGRFETVAEKIALAVKDIPSVTVIDGMALVPQDYLLYADLRLHPSDAGFMHYAKNLAEAIKKAL